MVVNISAKDGFIWDESYLLGNEQVDTQHRQLFDLTNSLVISCANGSEKDKTKEALDFLVNYTVQHFSDEEELQKKYNYPGYENHKKLHEDFKINVASLVQRFMENKSVKNLSVDVKTTVLQWLVNHILNEDKKIGEHIKSCSG